MRNKALLILLIIVICFSLFIKFQFLITFNQFPLSGDAPGFLKRAVTMNNFYACSVREPFWILWTKLSSGLTRDHKTGMRIGNIMLSLLSGILIYIIVNKFLGTAPAFGAATFFLFIPYLFYSPIRAHRLEMYLFLLLLFTHLILNFKPKPSIAIITGIISSLLVLVRMESLVIIIPGIIWLILKSRFNKLLIAAFTLIPLFSIASPFFYNCYKEKGSPLYVINHHSKFYSRHEQAIELNTLPEKEALANPYNAPKINITKYLFGMHSPFEIFKRFIGGYYVALTKASKHILAVPVKLDYFIYFSWIGFIVLLTTAKGRILLVWGLLYILPHAFILSTRVVGKSSTDVRFAAAATPLLAFGIAGFCWGAKITGIFIHRELKNRVKIEKNTC